MRTTATRRPHRAGTLNNCASGQTPWHLPVGRRDFAFYSAAVNAGRSPAPLGLAQEQLYRWPERRTFRCQPPPQRVQTVSVGRRDRPAWERTARPSNHGAGPRRHEGAWVATTRDGRGGVSGEDARFEYTTSSSARPHQPGGARANRELSTTASCTWRASMPMAPGAGCRSCTAKAR